MLIDETLTYTSAAGTVEFASYSGAVFHVNRDGVTGLDGLRNDLFADPSAGQDGAVLSGDALLPRNIVIAGTINAADQDGLDLRLQRVLNPKLPGELLYENPQRRRRIAVRVEQAPEIVRGYRRQFHISLIAHDPYFYDAGGEARTDIAVWLPMVQFDWIIPEEGTVFELRQESLIVNVRNEGDVDVGFRAVIRAFDEAVNPEILHMGTRERIALRATLRAGEGVEVDTRNGNKSIWLLREDGTRERAFHLRGAGMRFFSLAPGDNLIRYDAEAGRENMTVEIYAANRYVSA